MLKSFSKFLPPTCVSTDKETKNYATEYNILKKLSVIELVQLDSSIEILMKCGQEMLSYVPSDLHVFHVRTV